MYLSIGRVSHVAHHHNFLPTPNLTTTAPCDEGSLLHSQVRVPASANQLLVVLSKRRLRLKT